MLQSTISHQLFPFILRAIEIPTRHASLSSCVRQCLFWVKKTPTVNIVRISGSIGNKDSATHLKECLPVLEKAFDKDKMPYTGELVAVALEVNSGGGSLAHAELLSRNIKRLSTASKIPVFAFVEDHATSAGFFLACAAAKEIYATPHALIGGIGVDLSSVGKHRFIQRYDIDLRVLRGGKHKVITSSLLPPTPEAQQIMQGLADDFHADFKRVVTESRGDRLKEKERGEIFEGHLVTAREAHRLGLIDGVNDLYSFFVDKYQDKVKFRPLRSHKTVSQLLRSSLFSVPAYFSLLPRQWRLIKEVDSVHGVLNQTQSPPRW